MTLEGVVKEFIADGRLTEIRHVVSEVEFLPKGFGKAVRVRIYRYLANDEMLYIYKTSHHPHTPLQAAPYIASDPWESWESWESSAVAAANRAVEELLFHLEEAQRKGHEPHDDWLVENVFWESGWTSAMSPGVRFSNSTPPGK